MTVQKAKTGRKSYTPTDKEREQVKMLIGMGLRDYEVAKVLGISPPTLRKYYADEIEIGHLEANAKVAQSLFKRATDPEKPDITAAIFWLKARAGWSDQNQKGKKEMAEEVAKTAHMGTEWDKLLQ